MNNAERQTKLNKILSRRPELAVFNQKADSALRENKSYDDFFQYFNLRANKWGV